MLSSNSAEPFVSYRHARTGRIGEAGQMPSGWRAEHLDAIEILDVGSRGSPWITLRLAFDAGPTRFIGLGLASYLAAPRPAQVGLTAEITLEEWGNIGDLLLIIRELKIGGALVGQAMKSLRLAKTAQPASLTHRMTTPDGLAEPVVMIRPRQEGPGELTLTFRGLAFGKVEDYPHWRLASAGD